jgi:hypothetical protein
VRRGFMDRVDFDYELGAALGGNTIYPDLNDLHEHATHDLDECGIVEVEVRLVRIVEPGFY